MTQAFLVFTLYKLLRSHQGPIWYLIKGTNLKLHINSTAGAGYFSVYFYRFFICTCCSGNTGFCLRVYAENHIYAYYIVLSISSIAFEKLSRVLLFLCRKKDAFMHLPCSLNVRDACEKPKKVEKDKLKSDDAVKKMKYLSKLVISNSLFDHCYFQPIIWRGPMCDVSDWTLVVAHLALISKSFFLDSYIYLFICSLYKIFQNLEML